MWRDFASGYGASRGCTGRDGASSRRLYAFSTASLPITRDSLKEEQRNVYRGSSALLGWGFPFRQRLHRFEPGWRAAAWHVGGLRTLVSGSCSRYAYLRARMHGVDSPHRLRWIRSVVVWRRGAAICRRPDPRCTGRRHWDRLSVRGRHHERRPQHSRTDNRGLHLGGFGNRRVARSGFLRSRVTTRALEHAFDVISAPFRGESAGPVDAGNPTDFSPELSTEFR